MGSITGHRSAIPSKVNPMANENHTRFERARIIGARALQIGMGAPLNASEEELRSAFKAELISLFGVEEANIRFVLDPLKIALYEYEHNMIPIDTDPQLD